MSSYLLPAITYIPDLDKHIIPTVSNNNKIIINRTLHKYLSILKLKIDECEVAWDKFKKYGT